MARLTDSEGFEVDADPEFSRLLRDDPPMTQEEQHQEIGEVKERLGSSTDFIRVEDLTRRATRLSEDIAALLADHDRLTAVLEAAEARLARAVEILRQAEGALHHSTANYDSDINDFAALQQSILAFLASPDHAHLTKEITNV